MNAIYIIYAVFLPNATEKLEYVSLNYKGHSFSVPSGPMNMST